MKKNFKCLAFMAAALLVGFSSCSNDNDNAGGNLDAKTPKNMKITINLPGTRTEGPAQGKTTASFTFGDLYLTDAAGTIKAHYDINSESGTETIGNTIKLADLTKGVLLKNLPGDAIYVYLVGNTKVLDTNNQPEKLPITGNISTVKALSLGIDSQVATEINGVLTNNVNLYGETTATNNNGELSEDGKTKLYKATITLAPTVARVELGSIKATGDIESFQVDGIFVDYYYPTASIDGTVDDATIAKHNEVVNFMNTFAGYPKSLYDWITKASDANVVAPTKDKEVWGYNVFASAAGSAVPRIIIRLSDVKAKTGKYTGPQFITIKGLKENGTLLGKIKAGSVYSLAAGLEFNEKDITVDPNTENIDVNVTVTVNPWNVVVVTPTL